MVKKICFFVLLAQLFLLPLSVYAGDHNPLRKLARGAVNTTLSVVEIPRQMIKVKQDISGISGDIAGIFWGPLKGFTFFLGRTAVGIYELTTFLIPPYKPVVKPEFIFADEEEE